MESVESAIHEHMQNYTELSNTMSEWVNRVSTRSRIHSDVRHTANEEREFWRGWLWEWCKGCGINWQTTKGKGVKVVCEVMRGWWDMWVRRCEIRHVLKKDELERERTERLNIINGTHSRSDREKADKWPITKLRVETGNTLI